jgi:hypothetical protein
VSSFEFDEAIYGFYIQANNGSDLGDMYIDDIVFANNTYDDGGGATPGGM